MPKQRANIPCPDCRHYHRDHESCIGLRPAIQPISYVSNFEVRTPIAPIDIHGFEPVELRTPDREVWIDGKRCPPTLNEIFLAGLDALGEEHLTRLEKEIKRRGWVYRA